MNYSLENNFLKITVCSTGAELVSVINKADGAEMMWTGDAEWWGRHAPILFPYCGHLRGDSYTYNGETYAGKAHGFARDMEFAAEECTEQALRFVLQANALTMEKYPFAFKLSVTFTLRESVVVQTVCVENEDDKDMRFGFGFHPAFACPFDDAHTPEDYDIEFSEPQSPDVMEVNLEGLMTRRTHKLFNGESRLPVTENLFENDSINLTGLTANYVSITERDTGRRVTVDVRDYPYVLLWSCLKTPLRFICIEPWKSLPDYADASGVWDEKQPGVTLQPAQSWSTELQMSFAR